MSNKINYLAFGSFDGVHIGHQSVINALLDSCARDNANSVVVVATDASPKPESFIYTFEEKEYVLKNLGVDKVVELKIDETVSHHNLVNVIFLDQLKAKKIFAGENAGENPSDNLYDECLNASLPVEKVSTVRHEDNPVSSEMVVNAIKSGDFNLVKKLMGHPYTVIGEVVHGKGEGHKYGMPTANLAFDIAKILPPHGVYATLSTIDNKTYKGYTNIGLRPSADNMTYVSIETLILDFNKDIYGKKETLQVAHFVRPIMKFSGGLAQVKKQVELDIQSVREKFSNDTF